MGVVGRLSHLGKSKIKDITMTIEGHITAMLFGSLTDGRPWTRMKVLAQGEVEHTTVRTFDRLAEVCRKYLVPGKRVLVSGEMRDETLVAREVTYLTGN